MIAPYNTSKLIANTEKTNTIGEELTLSAVKKVLEIVLHHSAPSNVINVPLSNDTVTRLIDKMAECVEAFLRKLLMSIKFSLLVDEPILPSNEALLLAYVRFLKESKIIQEMLFERSLISDTNGEVNLFLILSKNILKRR